VRKVNREEVPLITATVVDPRQSAPLTPHARVMGEADTDEASSVASGSTTLSAGDTTFNTSVASETGDGLFQVINEQSQLAGLIVTVKVSESVTEVKSVSVTSNRRL